MITADEGCAVVREAFKWIEKSLERSNLALPESQIQGMMLGLKPMVFAMGILTDPNSMNVCIINHELNRMHDELVAKFQK